MAVEVFAELAIRKMPIENSDSPEVFETVKVDPITGILVTEDSAGEQTPIDHTVGNYVTNSKRVPGISTRSSTRVGKGVRSVYNGFVHSTYLSVRSVLLFIGALKVLSCKSPDVEPIMSYNVKMSHDEFMNRNRTWGQVKKRADQDK